MDDLVAFLRARVAEDEARARSAAESYGDRWTADASGGVRGSIEYVSVIGEPGSPDDYVARHDPARVLREVDAKRRIVDRYAWLREHGDTGDAAWILPLLAAAYADHPDYREEWRP